MAGDGIVKGMIWLGMKWSDTGFAGTNCRGWNERNHLSLVLRALLTFSVKMEFWMCVCEITKFAYWKKILNLQRKKSSTRPSMLYECTEKESISFSHWGFLLWSLKRLIWGVDFQDARWVLGTLSSWNLGKRDVSLRGCHCTFLQATLVNKLFSPASTQWAQSL